MILKVYPTYLSAVANINISILVPIIIGLIIGGLFFMKLIKICFDKFYEKTYYTIIGFSLRFIIYIIA